MKNIVRGTLGSLLLIAACMAHGDVPSMSVTVSDAGGNAAFKGTTRADGSFATRNLPTGNYVVQFNAKSSAVKGNHYALVVSAGSKRVSASAVPGEKFTGGGVGNEGGCRSRLEHHRASCDGTKRCSLERKDDGLDTAHAWQ